MSGWRASRARFGDVVALQEALGCPEPLAWVLARRGLTDPGAARAFLDAADGETPLSPPEEIPGIPEAADRLALAVRRREPIVVHGDYDCDGITSTAILVRALEGRGGRVRAFLPSRFTDGYGVSEATVERLAEEGCKLLVCVDCGTTAVEPLTRAVELGMDAVVCDHHLAGGLRPPAILANPALGRGGDALPAAAGVVLKLVWALSQRLDGDRLAPAWDEGLDLVALATVADAVGLVGENRRLVARGLARMRTEPRPAVLALCRAAGVATRAIDARTLGFTLGPAVNASGRLTHPEQALKLLLSTDEREAQPLADELWALNKDRREVERQIVGEAVAMLEAEPDEVREAGAVVAVGDGWHEGVVGIVASRLVERFGRPAIVLTRDGTRAKGSGRSLPGIDLHALVGSVAGHLTRWGGHQGAVGLELPEGAVAAFRRDLAEAAEGLRPAIARARVRIVDAVVGGGDIALRTAEALESLAPFGRGNPEVRLALVGCEAGGAAKVGEGRHLQLRLKAAGVHARAIGFGMGERPPEIAPDARYDAVVRLEVERWQDIVGPRLVLEAIERIEPRPLPGLCEQGCDLACPSRVAGPDLRALLDASDDPPPAPAPAAPPIGVRDRRGDGAAVATLAALAGADGGAVAVVADVARRRAALLSSLAPARLGIEVAVLGGGRCDPGALRERLALARGGPVLVMLDYERLAEVDLPDGAHLALLDPPSLPAHAEWARAKAAGRWLHLLWGPDEVAFATEMAEAEWDLRPVAAEIWRALADGRPRAWGPEADAAVLGDGPVARAPRAAARALAVLRDLGLVRVDAAGVAGVVPAPRRDLSESLRHGASQQRLARAKAMLAQAAALDLFADAGGGPPPPQLTLTAGAEEAR